MKIFELKSVDSTSNYAKKVLLNGHRDILVIAEEQTAGYGTNARKWVSPIGNLYMSFSTTFVGTDVTMLSYTMCCVLHKIISKYLPTNISILIKSPNDILVMNKKISGILIENFKENVYIIGVGINLSTSPLQTSICFSDIIEHSIEARKIALEIMQSFDITLSLQESSIKQYYYKFLNY